MQQLASVEIERSLLDQADGHLHEALAWLEQADKTNPVAIAVLTSLSKLSSMRGDAVVSLEWCQRILVLRKTLPGDHRADVAMDYNNLGTAFYNLSRFHESDEAFSRGIDLLESRFGNDHPRLGFVLFGRAAALVQLGRFNEARTLLDRSDAARNPEGGKSTTSSVGAVSSERMRAVMEFYESNYQTALHRLDAAIAQTRLSSPVSVAPTLTVRARIELASGHPAAAADTLTESENLYVKNGRAGHLQRWVAHGLHGVALVGLGDSVSGDGEIEEAFKKISANGLTNGIELAEMALRSGSAARRRGDIVLALQRHQIAQAFQAKSAWLGELGKNLITAELVLDGLLPGANAGAKHFSEQNIEPTIAVLQKLSPNNPLTASLVASRSGTPAK